MGDLRAAWAALLLAVLVVSALDVRTAAAAGQRREHGTHGTVRKLCATTAVERWPGGPRVGWARRGTDMRRYWFRGAWALGVVEDAKAARGYVVQHAFCPPSARGREALRRDRAAMRNSGGRGGRGRSTALARPFQARICAPSVWLRDHPIDRAVGILFAGDVFTARRRARNPWYGGVGAGHEHRAGWIPRSALCSGLPRVARGARLVAHDGFTVQVPPSTVACSARLARRKLIAVGTTFAPGSATSAVRADLVVAGHTELGPVFRRGEAPSLARGAVGPFHCGRRQHVVYTVLAGAGKGKRLEYAVTVGARAASARAVVAPPRARPAAFHRPPSPGTSCTARPTLVYAHGHEGPVSHRYDARPAISAGGGVVAFDSPLALLAPDAGSDRDVYVRRGPRLVADSRLAAGTATSRAPAISADGRRVAFESDDPGLAAGDRNGARDVFVSDADGPPRLVSATRSGSSGNARSRAPSLSADGRLVAFESRATDLVAGAPREGVYVADLATGSVRLAVADAYRPALSGDGTTLVFETVRARSGKDHNKTWDVYALKLAGGPPVLVSATPRGAAARGRSLAGVPSADARYVAFMSSAPDVVAGDTGGVRDVFRRDLRSGRTILISRDRCGGFANGYSRYPSISADGRRVAFDSHAEDIVRAPSHGEGEIYVRDVPSGRTTLASRRPDGRPGSRTSFSPALSSNGRQVAFPSFSADLTIAEDTNKKVDQHVATLRAGGRVGVRRVS
ncbi:TolB family protein [Baekduia sp. Peel2402]|uniref:TolB family protein n=1 Tax=Baekduia sp. Peel2402 TaxID=3458296 RepID=UPI00403EE03C